MSRQLQPWMGWLAVAGVLAVAIELGQWAARQNAQRDQGITWLWAYSPRSMQTYLVRSAPDGDARGLSFRLESSAPYSFRGCSPSKGDDGTPCLDQNGDTWRLELD
ncbi:hypothetical protein GCM10027266_09340 [Arenimonas alkanexedens]